MKKRVLIMKFIMLLAILVAVFSVSGCSGSGKPKVIVGSKDFTENILVSELYAQALEANGFTVERKQALGGTPIIHEAMKAGEVNVYAEYTSTALVTVLGQDPEFDSGLVYDLVKAGYSEQFDFVWLEMSDVNNSQGLAITKEASEAYGVTNLTELSKAAHELRLCSTAEFEERQDGLTGLKERLGGFDFASIRVYDKGIKYEVLRNGEADVNVCFTTDANLSKGDIVALEDDIQFWPPYYLAPVVRGDLLNEAPEIESILNSVSSALDTSTMQELNAKVDIGQMEYSEVAAEFLKEKGIVR